MLNSIYFKTQNYDLNCIFWMLKQTGLGCAVLNVLWHVYILIFVSSKEATKSEMQLSALISILSGHRSLHSKNS